MAVDDLNKNATILFQGRKLELLEFRPEADRFSLAVCALDLLQRPTVAIIGPIHSIDVQVVSPWAQALKVPLVSFSASHPSLSDKTRYPYFLRTVPSDDFQMQAMAQLIQFFNWSGVVMVVSDEEFGFGAFWSLEKYLLGTGVHLSQPVPIPLTASVDEIYRQMQEGFVYMSNALVNSTKLENFYQAWESGPGRTLGPPDIYTLRAYDTVSLLGEGIARGLQEGSLLVTQLSGDQAWGQSFILERNKTRSAKSEPLPLNALSRAIVRTAGAALLNMTLMVGQSDSFTRLAGPIGLDKNGDNVRAQYNIYNIARGISKPIGSWSTEEGLVMQSPLMMVNESSFSDIVWPGGGQQVPLGWLPASGRALRVAVPTSTYEPFVKIDPNKTGNAAFSGFCIDVFEAALSLLSFKVAYTYIPSDASYNDICTQVRQGDFDLAVGDFSITDLRSKVVDFTQQYKASGLVVIAPLVAAPNNDWAFLKPFTVGMWLAIASLFILMACAILWLEKGRRGPLSGKLRNSYGRAIWWSYNTLFFAQAPIVRTPLGRIVAGLWLFVVLIIVSSYQANLSSTLTVTKLLPRVPGITSITQSSRLVVGVSKNSWYIEALHTLGVPDTRIRLLDDNFAYYLQRFRMPSRLGGIDAVVDELPYAELFVSHNCQYGLVAREFYKGGWGFPCQKGSRLQEALSRALLHMSKMGKLVAIQRNWIDIDSSCGKGAQFAQANRLGLPTLTPLFILLLSVAAVCSFVTLGCRTCGSTCRTRRKHEDSRERNLSKMWSVQSRPEIDREASMKKNDVGRPVGASSREIERTVSKDLLEVEAWDGSISSLFQGEDTSQRSPNSEKT